MFKDAPPFSFPDAKSRRPIRASARNKIQFLYAFEHLQYSISGFAPKEQKRANVVTIQRHTLIVYNAMGFDKVNIKIN